MANFFIVLLVSIFLVEGLVELLAKSAFFGFVKEFLENKAEVNKFWLFWYSVISCPYCLSVWVSIFVVLLIYLASLLGNMSFGLIGFAPADLAILVVLSHRLSNHFHDFCDKHLNKYYSR